MVEDGLVFRHDQLLENAEAAMIILSPRKYLGVGFARRQLGVLLCLGLLYWEFGVRVLEECASEIDHEDGVIELVHCCRLVCGL